MKYFYRIKHWFIIKTRIVNSYDLGRYFALEVKCGYIAKNGHPIECQKCGCKDFEQRVTDTLDGHTVMEYELLCKRCNNMVGYWAYGNWTI